MMVDAESPRTLFDVLYTHLPSPPLAESRSTVCYDNGCNFDHFALNREPNFFKYLDVAIDHFHYSEHNRCSIAYDSHEHADITDSSLSEQKNTFFAILRSLAVNMNQDTVLWWIRHKLHRMNTKQRLQNEGRCFYARRKNDAMVDPSNDSVVTFLSAIYDGDT